VFSDYDVDLTSGRTWFQGVRLYDQSGNPTLLSTATAPIVPTKGDLDNKVFKIMLLNNGQYFDIDSGYEFRANAPAASAEEFRFIAARGKNTYYLQSVTNRDEYVSF